MPDNKTEYQTERDFLKTTPLDGSFIQVGRNRIYPLDFLSKFKQHLIDTGALQAGKWVSVENRLPENFKAVLVEADFIGQSYMAETTTVGCYQKDHWTTDRDADHDMVQIIVNRWMPLPSSYNQELHGMREQLKNK